MSQMIRMRILFALVFSFLTVSAFAQTAQCQAYDYPRRNYGYDQTLALEAGGAALYGSLNYEWMFMNGPFLDVGIRPGLGYGYLTQIDRGSLMAPLMLTATYGDFYKIEIGFGQTFFLDNNPRQYATPLNIGIRVDPYRSAFTSRIGYYPMYRVHDKKWVHWAGISFGVRFGE